MAIIALRPLLDHAAEHSYGIAAFNVNNMEQILAIMTAAEEVDSPVILQASAGARTYAGGIFLRKMIEAASLQFPNIPICMHLDHGASLQLCKSAISEGFTSVMIDGSLLEDGKTPSDFCYNLSVTRSVVDFAHAKGVSVEAELGVLGSLQTGTAGKEDGIGAEGILNREQMLTDPDQAATFVQLTQVDALAIAIGTSHGAYKFSTPPSDDVLCIDRIAKIRSRLPNTHLVMHGASSVPQNMLEKFRALGGQINPTYGVPLPQIVQAIRYGVSKINIDTDLRLAMSIAVREHLIKYPNEFDPRKYLLAAGLAAKELCKQRFELFASAGQASKIKKVSLVTLAGRYSQSSIVQGVA